MSRRMTIIGLAALCALALSAISAAGASAGVTATTCLSGASDGGGSTTTNVNCETGSTGTFGMKTFTGSTPLGLNTITPPVLTGKLFGATVELKATGVNCVGCKGENKEVGGVMEVVGSGGSLEFVGVKVAGAESKCTVVGSATEKITTKALKFTTTSLAGATLEPVTETLLAQFNITGSECTVAGNNIKVTGKAAATLNGAKLTVNVTKASEELKLEGEKASMTGVGTVKNKATNTALALTTTTP